MVTSVQGKVCKQRKQELSSTTDDFLRELLVIHWTEVTRECANYKDYKDF